jgi:GR25 family glycosyltransferase involved in LPS biosynthesis
MNYVGSYINLDRRTDRRAEIEAELTHFGLLPHYRRFSAVEGNGLNLSNPFLTSGEMGCFSSHYLLLKESLGLDRHLHVIEDDVVFSFATAEVINTLIEQNLFAGCDIVYTDVFVPIVDSAYKAYKKFYDSAVTRDENGRLSVKSYSVAALKGLPFGSTSSYMVNKDSIQKLHDLYAQQIVNEPSASNDLFIRALNEAGLIKVGCIFPFVTSVRLDHIIATDIERNYHKASALAAHLGRYSFFIGADFDKAREDLNTYLPLPPANDPTAQVLSHVLAFSLTDNYRPF